MANQLQQLRLREAGMIRREYENLQKQAKKPKYLPIKEDEHYENLNENEAKYLAMLDPNDITASPEPAKPKKFQNLDGR